MTVASGRSYLLDTNVLIRLDRSPKQISRTVLALLEDRECVLYASAASFWESSIKQSVGKLDGGLRLDSVTETYGMQELAISSKYTEVVRHLPPVHGDPFDRMLVAQAMVEGSVLVTADRRLAEYGVTVLQV